MKHISIALLSCAMLAGCSEIPQLESETDAPQGDYIYTMVLEEEEPSRAEALTVDDAHIYLAFQPEETENYVFHDFLNYVPAYAVYKADAGTWELHTYEPLVEPKGVVDIYYLGADYKADSYSKLPITNTTPVYTARTTYTSDGLVTMKATLKPKFARLRMTNMSSTISSVPVYGLITPSYLFLFQEQAFRYTQLTAFTINSSTHDSPYYTCTWDPNQSGKFFKLYDSYTSSSYNYYLYNNKQEMLNDGNTSSMSGFPTRTSYAVYKNLNGINKTNTFESEQPGSYSTYVLCTHSGTYTGYSYNIGGHIKFDIKVNRYKEGTGYTKKMTLRCSTNPSSGSAINNDLVICNNGEWKTDEWHTIEYRWYNSTSYNFYLSASILSNGVEYQVRNVSLDNR